MTIRSSAIDPPFVCVLASWRDHETELRSYLLHRLSDPHRADDLVQDIFLKAKRYGKAFCTLGNPRAWLFQVARNTRSMRYDWKNLPFRCQRISFKMKMRHPLSTHWRTA